ncbi:sialidase [Chloropicon primus]|uniref:Sialidase n=1 Tax=Chloropicon primus TaxID=1764295 RepID=A0A5B8MMQ6_9CHLO|nr:sialidase [Chloropicon primus]UPR01004.1 sialidase [Chloropicon primus]|eukprot:QDZ21783.1 sialidase [Chloropicon primus]
MTGKDLESGSQSKSIVVHRASPGPMQYNHMAMLDKLDNGSLVLVWQFSSGIEGVTDQRLALSLSSDDSGTSWSAPRVIPIERNREKGAIWSPVLHSMPGKLLLLYAESNDCVIHKGGVKRFSPGGTIKSVEWDYANNEEEFSWTAPRTVHDQREGDKLPKVLANKLIELKSGELVLPMWSEKHGSCQKSKEKGSAGVLVSADSGQTWVRRGNLFASDTWLIENTVVERSDGLLMLFRTKKGYIYRSLSTDKGYTWSRAKRTHEPNPDAKIHALRLSNTTIALASNRHKKFQKPSSRGCRTNLDVALSPDGETGYKRVVRVEHEVDTGLRSHYPTLYHDGKCKLFLAYTRFYHESVQERSKWELFGTSEWDKAPVLGVFVRIIDFA